MTVLPAMVGAGLAAGSIAGFLVASLVAGFDAPFAIVAIVAIVAVVVGLIVAASKIHEVVILIVKMSNSGVVANSFHKVLKAHTLPCLESFKGAFPIFGTPINPMPSFVNAFQVLSKCF